MKNFKTKVFFVFATLLITSFSVFPRVSFAADEIKEECNPEYLIYEQADGWFDLDIRRIVHNMITSAFVSIYASVNGVTLNSVIGCEKYIVDTLNISFLPKEVTPCDHLSADACSILVNSVKAAGSTSYETDPIASRVRKSVSGSLLGIGYSLENFNRREPLLLNLAFFWNKSIAKVPFASRALAVPASVQQYNMPLLEASFSIWRLCRNASLGIMSIILLYTGILIIMRKKVNPQLVVNVQYAIPKIAIGLILIIFSYPIGAAIIAITWGVFRGAFDIVMTFPGLISGPGADVPAGAVFIAIQQAQIRYGMGNAILVLTLVISILCAILWIVVNIKAVFLYFKMVIAVVTAPFEMAIGTVPGSESRIMDWFKRMAKYGLSVMAMGFAVPMVIILGFEITKAYSQARSEVGGFGSILRVIVPLGVVIYGFTIAISIDKTVAGFFGEDKKKK